MAPLAIAITVSVLSHLSLTGARVLVPLIALQDGASPLTVGLLGALFTLLPMFGSAALGRLLDRIGPRLPVLLACAIAAGGMAIGAFWPGQVSMFFVAPLVGAGTMLVYMASTETVGSSGLPSRRARNFSWLSLGYSASAFAGPLAAGLLLEFGGQSIAFGALTLAPLLALAVAVTFRSTWRATPNAAPPVVDRKGRLRDLLRSPGVAITLVTSSLMAGAHNLITFVVPIHATQHGLGAVAVGQVLAVYALGAIAVRTALPWLAARFTPRWLVAVSLLVAASAYAALPSTVLLGPLLGLSMLLGLAIGAVQPTLLALLYVVSPSGRLNETSGVNVGMNMAAQTLVPMLFGMMGGALGIGLVCWIYAAGLLANIGGLRRLEAPPTP